MRDRASYRAEVKAGWLYILEMDTPQVRVIDDTRWSGKQDACFSRDAGCLFVIDRWRNGVMGVVLHNIEGPLKRIRRM